MQVKRVLNLAQDEFEALVKAGEILGSVNKILSIEEDSKIDNNEFADELSPGAKELVEALKTITEKILNK